MTAPESKVNASGGLQHDVAMPGDEQAHETRRNPKPMTGSALCDTSPRRTALGHEHEYAVGAPHGSFTLNCGTSGRRFAARVVPLADICFLV
jgi:hypothetical protein